MKYEIAIHIESMQQEMVKNNDNAKAPYLPIDPARTEITSRGHI